MAYVFLSHASEDKSRVRPLAKALALEGLNLWLDRPGHGPSHFNFDRDFIERHGIRELPTGRPWPEEISSAVKEASAVLLCISKSLNKERTVWAQEVLLGAHAGKLAACIVDDVPCGEIPTDLGLLDPSKLQAERIDPALLDRAAREVEVGRAVDSLPGELRSQWEIVRKLAADIRAIFARLGVQGATLAEVRNACAEIGRYPIGPTVAPFEIPDELISLFADLYADPAKAQRFVALAMQVRWQCNAEGFTERQIMTTPGELLRAESVSPEEYWTNVLTLAGSKSRRTLAALLLAPGAPRAEALGRLRGEALAGFLAWLEKPPAGQAA